MTKRKLTKIMTSALLVTGATLPVIVQVNVASSLFKDVYIDDSYAESIHYLAERGIIQSVDGYYYPTQPIALTAAIDMLENYLKEDLADQLLYARALFEGNDIPLIYEETALLLVDFIYAATGIDSVEAVQANADAFLQYGEPYRQAVATLVALKVPFMQDASPQQSVTRGQFADLLGNVIRFVIETRQLRDLLQLDDFLLEQMEFTADGTALFGKGAVPGTTITVRNVYNDVIGTGFIERDGSYRMPLFPAVANDEHMTLELKDEANNRLTIERVVQLEQQEKVAPVLVDFVVGSDEESLLAMSLEQFLQMASVLAVTDVQFVQVMKQARQTLANWQVTDDEILAQLDAILYQFSRVLTAEKLQQVHQMLFIGLKVLAEQLQQESYSKNSWRQLEKVLLHVDAPDVLFATQIQQAYYGVSKLVTKAEQERRTMQDGFSDLQETILAIETLLVDTSLTGEDISPSVQWTTSAEKAVFRQAVERALDVYIQFDPTITEILEAQSQLDLAIIHYEESKRFGRRDVEKINQEKQLLQQVMNDLQLVAISEDGNDIYTNAQWTTSAVRERLDAVIGEARQVILNDGVTLESLMNVQERLLREIQHYYTEKQFGRGETVNDLKRQIYRSIDEVKQLL